MKAAEDKDNTGSSERNVKNTFRRIFRRRKDEEADKVIRQEFLSTSISYPLSYEILKGLDPNVPRSFGEEKTYRSFRNTKYRKLKEFKALKNGYAYPESQKCMFWCHDDLDFAEEQVIWCHERHEKFT